MEKVPDFLKKKSVAETHPEVADIAVGWDPKDFTSGSSQYKDFRCPFNHIFNTKIKNVTGGGTCPYCSGHKVLSGFNDLGTTHPLIAAQAENFDVLKFSAGSSFRGTWKCLEGHLWEASIAKRVAGKGCPICSGKKPERGRNDLVTTHPEAASQAFGWDPTNFKAARGMKMLWRCPLGHQYEAVIQNRTRMGNGCPICSGHQVLVGFNDIKATHPGLAEEANGWDPEENSAGSNITKEWKCPRGHFYFATIYDRTYLSRGCDYCENRKVLHGFNDLKSNYPQISKEAFGWFPEQELVDQVKSVKWICFLGHIWTASIKDRQSGAKCHFCSGRKVLIGFNDVKTLYPDVAAEAYKWNPQEFTGGSNKQVEWLCPQGHIWIDVIYDRALLGSGCHICSGRKLLVGYNDLGTTHPEIASQADGWDTTTLTYGSNQVRKWRCEEGHSWNTEVASRTAGRGCPSCAKYGYSPEKDGYLYFLRHLDWGMLQIGITNDAKERTGRHASRGWQILEIKGPMDGLLARAWEKSILEFLLKIGAIFGPNTEIPKFDGYTEAWLEASFSVESLTVLMELVQCDE
jgi:hypothetical protein